MLTHTHYWLATCTLENSTILLVRITQFSVALLETLQEQCILWFLGAKRAKFGKVVKGVKENCRCVESSSGISANFPGALIFVALSDCFFQDTYFNTMTRPRTGLRVRRGTETKPTPNNCGTRRSALRWQFQVHLHVQRKVRPYTLVLFGFCANVFCVDLALLTKGLQMHGAQWRTVTNWSGLACLRCRLKTACLKRLWKDSADKPDSVRWNVNLLDTLQGQCTGESQQLVGWLTPTGHLWRRRMSCTAWCVSTL